MPGPRSRSRPGSHSSLDSRKWKRLSSVFRGHPSSASSAVPIAMTGLDEEAERDTKTKTSPPRTDEPRVGCLSGCMHGPCGCILHAYLRWHIVRIFRRQREQERGRDWL